MLSAILSSKQPLRYHLHLGSSGRPGLLEERGWSPEKSSVIMFKYAVFDTITIRDVHLLHSAEFYLDSSGVWSYPRHLCLEPLWAAATAMLVTKCHFVISAARQPAVYRKRGRNFFPTVHVADAE